MNKRLFKPIIISSVVVALTIGLGTAVIAVAAWFDHNRVVFHSPVEVAFFQPVKFEERKPEVIIERFSLDYPDEIDTPIEKYICDKWGVYDCKTALAVAKAESGLKEQAVNINNNDTIDVGIFQINTVHFDKEGCSLKDIVDAHKNVDCAYLIWDLSDSEHKLGDGKGSFEPWVAFWNGNFRVHI